MKVLLFGGTRFMGRYVLKALLAQGAEVTIANRGTREENSGATNVICDRSQPGSLEQFRDSKFDVVISLLIKSKNTYLFQPVLSILPAVFSQLLRIFQKAHPIHLQIMHVRKIAQKHFF
jgi:NAD(P)-dependent dehydrogenase (short-subunit alcohol dehydrogenase family)